MRSHVNMSLVSRGVPATRAAHLATSISQSQAGGTSIRSIPHFIRLDFAYATRSVLYVMTAIMGFAGVVALFGLRRGLQDASPTTTGGSVDTTGTANTPGTANATGTATAG